MMPIGNRHPLSTELLERHHYVCDLLRSGHPILSLYTDGRQNWCYLWSDTDSSQRHRWLLFPISRASLATFLDKKVSLRSLLMSADRVWMLEDAFLAPTTQTADARRSRRYLWSVQKDAITAYLPSEDSTFDESIAPDIDLTKQVVPTTYDVPIKGTWFSNDFQYLFRRYERLYAFFYATKPRFVRTIDTTLAQLLRAPWTGGFSRVNLYSTLAQRLPAIHALKVDKLQFGSPGDVKFEALRSIGDSIQNATSRYLAHNQSVDEAYKTIKKALTAASVNKLDLSKRTDQTIGIDPLQIASVVQACDSIATTLGVQEEFLTLRSHAPNSVVYGKAVNSFIRQLAKFADLQTEGMLNF